MLRAALLSRRGPWPRTVGALAAQVGAAFHRADARWVAAPEEDLAAAILRRLPAAGPAGPPIAAPAWGRPGFAEVLSRFHQVHWMEPARGRFDPGPSEVAAALDAGARAVLLAPVAGDGSALPKAAELCRGRGALLALDARASIGTRILEGGPERFGDLVLLPVDGEPVPSPCGGAILCGDASTEDPDRVGRSGLRWAAAAVVGSLAYEPRLHRFWRPNGPTPTPVVAETAPPPPWSVAAASVRLAQAPHRAMQRARHAQVMRINFGHLPAIERPEDPPGFQTVGGAFAVLAAGREGVCRQLDAQGIRCLPGVAGWLAPDGQRSPRATEVSERALFLPLHPFFRPPDIEMIGEALRRATLRTNGTGWGDPGEED